MARPSGDFTGGLLLVAQKAFVAGCSGCIGVAGAALVVFVLAFGVFQPQLAALVRVISLPQPPFVISVQSAPTVCPVPTAQLAAIDIFVTSEQQPLASRVTQIKSPVQQPLFVCVRGSKGPSVRFAVRLTMPDGRLVPLGDFVSDPTGKAVCVVPLGDLSNVQGSVRIEAIVGTAVVGSTVLIILP